MMHTPGSWSVESYKAEWDAGETWLVTAGDDEIEVCDEANARLIAAAPDLLAALERAIPDIAVTGHADQLAQARAAIAKARGRS